MSPVSLDMAHEQQSNERVVQTVRKWVNTLVVDRNLCPFARHEMLQERVRFESTNATTEEQLLGALQNELELLNSDPSIETTLLIHPAVLQSFDEYNQFLNYTDTLLVELGLEGIYQIASFHPDYQFAETNPDDVENYTNRSPYPLLHIIREESLERAIEDYPDIEQIPIRNVALMKSLGLSKLQMLFESLFK